MKCCASHKPVDDSCQDSFLSRIDPRIKVISALILLAINLRAVVFVIPMLVAAAMLALMMAGRVPYRRQLLMIAFPAAFAIFAVASQTLFKGTRIFASIGPADLHLDGLLYGLFISTRIIAGGLIMVVLGVSTPLNRLCLALKWFKVPLTFLEVLQLTYRYLFDIRSEFSRMREAQRARLGWSSAKAGLASSRMLGGSLFLRVYERGLRSSEAMRCRGSGPVVNGSLAAPGGLDAVAAAVAASFAVVLIYVSLVM